MVLSILKWLLFSFGFVKGVICPTGCELKDTVRKQERNIKPTVADLKRSVDELSRNTNSVSRYIDGLSDELRERQKVTDGKIKSCPSPAEHHTSTMEDS